MHLKIQSTPGSQSTMQNVLHSFARGVDAQRRHLTYSSYHHGKIFFVRSASRWCVRLPNYSDAANAWREFARGRQTTPSSSLLRARDECDNILFCTYKWPYKWPGTSTAHLIGAFSFWEGYSIEANMKMSVWKSHCISTGELTRH